MQDLPDLVLVRFDQLADLEGRVTAERCNVLAGDRGVVHAFDRLITHPADDRDARVAEYHQRVVNVAHDASELELEDRVEGKDDAVPVDLVVLAGHGCLLYSERSTRPCRGRGTCVAAPWHTARIKAVVDVERDPQDAVGARASGPRNAVVGEQDRTIWIRASPKALLAKGRSPADGPARVSCNAPRQGLPCGAVSLAGHAPRPRRPRWTERSYRTPWSPPTTTGPLCSRRDKPFESSTSRASRLWTFSATTPTTSPTATTRRTP